MTTTRKPGDVGPVTLVFWLFVLTVIFVYSLFPASRRYSAPAIFILIAVGLAAKVAEAPTREWLQRGAEEQEAQRKVQQMAAMRAAEDDAWRRGETTPNQFEEVNGVVRLFFSHYVRGTKLDETYTVKIESDLGPIALVLWEYDPAKIQGQPFFSPETINDRLAAVGQVKKSNAYHYLTQKDHMMTHRALHDKTDTEAQEYVRRMHSQAHQHFDFTVDDVLKVIATLPINVLKMKYADRRKPFPDAIDADKPLPFPGVRLGMTMPPEVEREPNAPYYTAPPKQPSVPAFIADDERLTTYMLGEPGKGKSTLMLNMFRQDVEAGKGVALIDPHGDLAKGVLQYIPRERWDDVIYFDPIESPIGIDFLKHNGDLERDVLADDLYEMFSTLAEKAGARMEAILKNAFPLLLRTPGATFLDLLRLVTDDQYRQSITAACDDQMLRDFWLRDYPKYPQPATSEPLISRMQRLSTSRALRTLTGTRSDFDFYDVIRQRKIFICNLSADYIRGDTRETIGSLIAMRFHLAVLKQASLPQADRNLIHLYVDEVHTFKSSSFHAMITGARKYGLRLTLANQLLDDLTPELRAAVRAAESRVYFRLQDEDAARIGRTVGDYTARDLQNLDIGEAIFRPGKPSDTIKIKMDLPPAPGESCLQHAIERTQSLYAARSAPEPPKPEPGSDDPEPGEWPAA